METTEILNDNGNLNGVVNIPDTNHLDDVAMIFINAGFLHRVGPYRLYTDLARNLSQRGISSLRFDLAGLGESLADPEVTDSGVENGQVSNIKAAMDFMQRKYTINRFIVTGLCSGADDSLDIAMADQRVVGALLIDGPGFKAGRFNLNHYALHYPRRLLSVQKWVTLGLRLIQPKGQANLQSMNDEIRREIDETELRQIVDTLLKREVSMLFLYSGGVSDYYNYHSQFEDMFPQSRNEPLLNSVYLPESDHLFMLNHHREELQEHVLDWTGGVVDSLGVDSDNAA